METLIRFIIISTFCLSVLYLGYLLFQRKETRFNQLRYFLLISIVLSLLLPFSAFRIDIDLFPDKYDVEERNRETVNLLTQTDELTINHITIKPENNNNWSFVSILITIYFIGLSFFGLRLLIHLIKILHLFRISEKITKHETTIYLNNKIESPFTFFKLIFIPNINLMENENKDIITHERIHASQYHSIDLILIELVSAVMWFNPLVWLMKKSVQLVHEYLADEGVLNTGTEKLRYQALLINHVAEERLICISSSFNHSLIKKRMTMMTKSKIKQHSKFRILILIPLGAVLFVIVSCINNYNKSDVITAVESVRMNVLYLGVDNPVKIAASGYDASDLSVSIDNGTITGENGVYVIRPKTPDSAIVTVSKNGKDIQKTIFRVKTVPAPVAKIAGKKGGTFLKQELLEQEGIYAEMENFDFDLNFDIVGFTVLTIYNGYVFDAQSNSDSFTDKQKKIIASTVNGSPVYIQDIRCKDKDGAIREISPINFKIIE